MKNIRNAGPIVALLLLASSLFFLNSCQKEQGGSASIPDGQQRVRIRLSDNPVSFDAVNVDIRRVEVLVVPDSCGGRYNPGQGGRCDYDHDGDHHDDNQGCAVWDTLDIRAGVYDLLHLANGNDTLLASGLTIAGRIKQVRLTLGTQNSVVIDSVAYPLTTWNGYNRVTITLAGGEVDQVSSNDLQLWLDFDAGRSIIRISNNHFVIKPYLRLWLPAQTGSIRGSILPREAHAVVAAIANGDTLIAIPDGRNGFFKIRGLMGTTANIFVNATANGYSDTTITGVQLTRGHDTDIGTIRLHN